jgi:hypothetical protein
MALWDQVMGSFAVAAAAAPAEGCTGHSSTKYTSDRESKYDN